MWCRLVVPLRNSHILLIARHWGVSCFACTIQLFFPARLGQTPEKILESSVRAHPGHCRVDPLAGENDRPQRGETMLQNYEDVYATGGVPILEHFALLVCFTELTLQFGMLDNTCMTLDPTSGVSAVVAQAFFSRR